MQIYRDVIVNLKLPPPLPQQASARQYNALPVEQQQYFPDLKCNKDQTEPVPVKHHGSVDSAIKSPSAVATLKDGGAMNASQGGHSKIWWEWRVGI